MIIRVFVDANVLHSRTLRDWLLLLRLRQSVPGMFQLHTTEDVIAEVMVTLRRRHPLIVGRALATVRRHIVESIDEVVEDFDPAAVAYVGEDPNDRHVHAAAVASQADILLTTDQGLLSMADLDDLPYEIFTPDDFFVLVDDSSKALVAAVTEEQRRYWARKKHHSGLEDALIKAGCPGFAARVREHLRTQSGLS